MAFEGLIAIVASHSILAPRASKRGEWLHKGIYCASER